MTTITQATDALAGVTLPDPSTDSSSTFSTNATATVAGIKALGNQLTTWTGQVNTVAGEVNTNATAAAAFASAAATSATSASTYATTASNQANVAGTSTTSTTPVLGSMSFTYVEASRAISVGMRLRAASAANPTTNFASGTVTAWNSGTKVVTLSVDNIGASPAAAADWNLMGEGTPGVGASLQTAKVTVTTTATLVKASAGAQVVSTNAATITLDNAALLGNGWAVSFPQTDTSYALTLNTSASQTIAVLNGTAGTSKTIPKGCPAFLMCDGTGFSLVLLNPYIDSEVTVTTGNGFGSTNTFIRRFTTTKRSVGNDVTFADSATLGATFTANTDGLYAIMYTDSGASGFGAGISKNTTTPTAAITSAAESEVLAYAAVAGVGVAGIFRLSAGDVIRAHPSSNSTPSTTNAVRFSIRKVGQ